MRHDFPSFSVSPVVLILGDRLSCRFVNAHLAAHTEYLQRRVQDYHTIVNMLLFPPLPSSDSKDPTTIFSSSHVFFFGDLNFRLEGVATQMLTNPSEPSLSIAELLRDETRPELKEYDQLVSERDHKGTAFVGFREGEFWQFKCSYKYKLGEVDKYEYASFSPNFPRRL